MEALELGVEWEWEVGELWGLCILHFQAPHAIPKSSQSVSITTDSNVKNKHYTFVLLVYQCLVRRCQEMIRKKNNPGKLGLAESASKESSVSLVCFVFYVFLWAFP